MQMFVRNSKGCFAIEDHTCIRSPCMRCMVDRLTVKGNTKKKYLLIVPVGVKGIGYALSLYNIDPKHSALGSSFWFCFLFPLHRAWLFLFGGKLSLGNLVLARFSKGCL